MKVWQYVLDGSPGGEVVEVDRPCLTDRSRYVTTLACKQKRWLEYHAGPANIGFGPKATYDDLALGSAVHLGMEAAMQAWHRSTLCGEQMDDRELAIAAYDVADYAFRDSAKSGLVMAGDPHMALLNPELYAELLEEQAALAGTLAGAGVAVWLPQIIEDYDLIQTEMEINWTWDGQVVMMSRPDAVLRRKRDGKIFVVSYKTTKTFYPSDLDRLSYDIQALTEMAAVTATGLPAEGVLYAYFIKGTRKKVTDGELNYSRYNSGLLRPWVDSRQLQPILRTRYESLPDPITGRKSRLGPNYDQLSYTEAVGPVTFSQYGLTPRDYFVRILDGEFDEEHGGSALQSLIAAPEAILRPWEQMDRIVRQFTADEHAWMEGLSQLEGDTWYRQAQMNPSACHSYNRNCQWVGACWGSGSSKIIELFNAGRIGIRTPNHSQEGDDE